jgi:hypothetical protein
MAASKPKFTQPFAEFPHIALRGSDGKYVEVCCPVCGGNTRNEGSHAFFRIQGFKTHITRAHKDHPLANTDLINGPNVRILTLAEVRTINAGKGRDIIQRKVVETRNRPAQTLRKCKLPIGLYTTIHKFGDKYYELFCRACNGNVNIIKGSEGGALRFLKGLKALRQHIREAHGEGEDEDQELTENCDKDAWIMENCARKITKKRFDQLRRDQTGNLIAKVTTSSAATVQERLDRKEAKKRARAAAKAAKESSKEKDGKVVKGGTKSKAAK